MSENAAEKQFQPSERKLERLKKEGNFLRAKDFSSGSSLVAAIVILMLLSHHFMMVIRLDFEEVFSHLELGMQEIGNLTIYRQLALDTFLMILSLGAALCIVVFSVTFLYGGFGFSMSLLKFKPERINPLKNLKKMFSLHQLMEVVKSTIKFFLFLSVFLVFLYKHQDALYNLSALQREDPFADAFTIIRSFLMFMMIPMVLIALVDMLYNYVSFNNKIKMTFQEVKDENKESDGSPEMKRKIRSAQQELLRRSLQKTVPQATVVITNPTHYAVALRYHENKDKAPKILAKGMDHTAAELRKLAIKNSIPIYEAPQLARAIYFTGKVGAYIHQDLYMAVAIVLSYVVQLKNYQHGLGQKPSYAEDLQIPKSLQF